MIDNKNSGAVFSNDMRYRYKLWRRWGENPSLAFCMLNPSTANETDNDPTVERCQRRAQAWGYGGLVVVNLFALRATDPNELYTTREPHGPDNGHHISMAADEAALVICAWGKHGALMQTGPTILARLRKDFGPKIRYLKLNRDGSPQHPLYLPYALKPQAWT